MTVDYSAPLSVTTAVTNDRLGRLLALQLEMQRRSFNTDPPSLNPDSRAEWIRWNLIALSDELHEALHEVGWKPWASSRHFNRDSYLKELVDAFHFLMNLILVAQLEDQEPSDLAREFADLYDYKRQVNIDRQRSGYDGTTGKCECGRAIEDGALVSSGPYRSCTCGRLNRL